MKPLAQYHAGKAAGNFTRTMYAGSLSTRERELARMRIAEINACPI